MTSLRGMSKREERKQEPTHITGRMNDSRKCYHTRVAYSHCFPRIHHSLSRSGSYICHDLIFILASDFLW
jgi:hypothetical protein